MENGHGFWLNELGSTARDASFSVLNFSESLPETEDYPTVLSRFISQADTGGNLSGQQKKLVLCALESAVTREETAAKLEYYRSLLTDELKKASDKEEKDSKLYIRLGIMAGLLTALLLW